MQRYTFLLRYTNILGIILGVFVVNERKISLVNFQRAEIWARLNFNEPKSRPVNLYPCLFHFSDDHKHVIASQVEKFRQRGP